MKWPHRLRIVIPGKIKFSFIKEGVFFYQQRLNFYFDFDVLERKIPAKVCRDPERLKALEAESLLAPVPEKAYVVALDAKGKELDSSAFAKKMKEIIEGPRPSFFLIGGPFGLAEKVIQRADFSLSLSKLTLCHEMALLVLCEQLYRGVSILAGEPYHK